jgi:hypothetical protein
VHTPNRPSNRPESGTKSAEKANRHGVAERWAAPAGHKRYGTSGAKSGHAHRPWAFAAAAVWCLRDQPVAPLYRARLATQPDQGQAFPLLAHTVARAVYPRLLRQVACDTEPYCQRSGRGAAEPVASLDTPGRPLSKALAQAACTASVNAQAPMRARGSEPGAWMGPPLALLWRAALVAHGLRGRLLTRAWFSRDPISVVSPLWAEDGRRARRKGAGAARSPTRLCPRRLGVASTARRVWGSHVRWRRDTESTSDHATGC